MWNIHNHCIFWAWHGSTFGVYMDLSHICLQGKQHLDTLHFCIACLPFTLSFPLKNTGTCTVVQFVLSNKVNTKNYWLIQIFDDIEFMVDFSAFNIDLDRELPCTWSSWLPAALNCSCNTTGNLTGLLANGILSNTFALMQEMSAHILYSPRVLIVCCNLTFK